MKIVKWGIVGIVGLAAIGAMNGGNDSPADRGSAPARERTADVPDEISEREIFELAIDLTIDDMDTTELCPAVDMLGMDLSVDQVHSGYGSGYWSDAYVAGALAAACN